MLLNGLGDSGGGVELGRWGDGRGLLYFEYVECETSINKWSVAMVLTTNSAGKGNLDLKVFRLPWCKYSHHDDDVTTINVTLLNKELKRGTQ